MSVQKKQEMKCQPRHEAERLTCPPYLSTITIGPTAHNDPPPSPTRTERSSEMTQVSPKPICWRNFVSSRKRSRLVKDILMGGIYDLTFNLQNLDTVIAGSQTLFGNSRWINCASSSCVSRSVLCYLPGSLWYLLSLEMLSSISRTCLSEMMHLWTNRRMVSVLGRLTLCCRE